MKALFTMSLVGLVLTIATLGSGILEADFKSSFLVDGRALSSLSYLSEDRDDEWRKEVRSVVLSNGDTHFDMLARNTDKDWGIVDGVNSQWGERLDALNAAGLAPVIWMRGDDSPEINALGLGNQLDYNDQVIAASDDKVSHYVACLECNEYYTPQAVNVILQRMRLKTDKPIGVHLTRVPGNEAYLAQADIIYLQTGFYKTEAQFRAAIEYALTLGKPVVVSEYNQYGTTAEARRFGNIACEYRGVVGTGNGRGSAICSDLAWKVKEEEWHEKYDDELAVFMLAIVTLSAAYGLKWNLPFQAKFNYIENEHYEVIMAAPVTETVDAGVTFRDDGKVMTFLRGSFGNIFKGYKPITREDNR
jgi:hypothetical protein